MENENLKLYNEVRAVPEDAKKTIGAGRLKGMTNIQPQWRIKMLTEKFGICGFGWKYNITHREILTGANGELKAFVDVELFIKMDGQWSDAIVGTGGSTFVEKNSSGYYTNDECYKMALTDALSVACKSLGIGADVYYAEDRSKYDLNEQKEQKKTEEPKKKAPTIEQRKELEELGGCIEIVAQYFNKEVPEVTSDDVALMIERKKKKLAANG